ncbi:MAG: FUN14 domain-containing protein, partial [bacterium]
AKKIGRALATLLGLAFIAIQGIVYTGYVSVDWEKLQKDAISAVDTTGDGKITADDFKVYWNKLKAFLTNGIPSASGFTVGFFYGLTPLHFRAIEDNFTFSDATGTYFYQKARQNQLILKV